MSSSVVAGHPSELSSGAALAGFLLSGLLLALPGALLPAWGHHIVSDFRTVGNYFLSVSLGVAASTEMARRLLRKKSAAFWLTLGSAIASAAALSLALASPPVQPIWRMPGLFGIGFGSALVNSSVFHAISPLYDRDPAATVSIGGVFFGIGSTAAALLVWGTFYVYTVASIMVIAAAVPAMFAILYGTSGLRTGAIEPHGTTPDLSTRGVGAILLALLLFFQFGNEWSVASWLSIFLIRRLGISPETSLLLLALYWAVLVIGRVTAIWILPHIRHGRLLLGSACIAVFGCIVLRSTETKFGAVSGILFVAAGFACIYPLVAEKIGKRFPSYQPGFFNGIFSFALLGGMLAPWTLGYLADVHGIGIVMGLPLVGTLAVFVLVLLIWLEARITRG
jgi:hypothetical protein